MNNTNTTDKQEGCKCYGCEKGRSWCAAQIAALELEQAMTAVLDGN